MLVKKLMVHFNSNMVRLKGSPRMRYFVACELFQFQYGSIKSFAFRS